MWTSRLFQSSWLTHLCQALDLGLDGGNAFLLRCTALRQAILAVCTCPALRLSTARAAIAQGAAAVAVAGGCRAAYCGGLHEGPRGLRKAQHAAAQRRRGRRAR